MNKGGVASDVLETLGGVVQSAGQQAISGVNKAGEDVIESLGVTPPAAPADQAAGGSSIQAQELEKMNQEAKQKAAAGYRKIQSEIHQYQQQREREIPKQVSGQPGFSEEKAIKQLEEKKAEEKKPPPIALKREQTKTERAKMVTG